MLQAPSSACNGSRAPAGRDLPPGTVLQVLAAAGVQLPPGAEEREKTALRCPLHDDRRPSAFIRPALNMFGCAVCGSFSAKKLAEALGVPWPLEGRRLILLPPQKRPDVPQAGLSSEEALARWNASLARLRDDSAAEEDAAVYEYLRVRSLSGVLDSGENLCGVLPPEFGRTYRLVAPLRDASGQVVGLQARAVLPLPAGAPRVRSPRGGRIREALFLSMSAVDALRGHLPRVPTIVGEGLSDFLALAVVAAGRWPVAALPGVGGAGGDIVGRLGRGRTVILALDQDEPGEKAACRAAGTISAAGGRPKRLRWPPGHKDACDLVEAYGLEALEAALAEAVGNV
jgi:DNA primase